MKMGQYRRKLKKGERWFYSGQYLGQKYFSKAIYLTKQECKKAERARIDEIDLSKRSPIKVMGLHDLMEDRLDYLKLKKSHDYYRETKRYFKTALSHWGNSKSANEISKQDINSLLMSEAKRLQGKNMTNFKVNSMLRSLKALFNYGIRFHDLDIKNPVSFVEFYPIDVHLKYIPTDKEIEAIRETLTKNQKFLFDFAEQTGCRIMEAVRFKAEDIDGDLITLWTRKSKNSNLTPRRIPKPECLADFSGDGKVFAEWNALPRFLNEKVKKTVQKNWSWHNLRHRRASLWAKNGLTTFEIMIRLGHSNLSTTMRYLQLLGFTRL